MWVADWGNSRLQHLGADGSVIDVIGPFPPETPGAMERPNDIAIDADGRLWVADVQGNQVLQFAADGSFLTSFGGSGDPDLPNDPASLDFDAEGLLYVADYSENVVLVFRPTN